MSITTSRGYIKPQDPDDAEVYLATQLPPTLDLINTDIVALFAAVAAVGATQLVNGGMEVFQRGGSITANNAYAHDRWQLLLGGTSTCTITDDPTIVATGSGHAMKVAYVHGSAVSYVEQKLEHYLQLRGRTVTFSFLMAKAIAGGFRPYIMDSGVRYYGSTSTTTGAYLLLTVTRVVGAASTGVSVGWELSASDTSYVDNAVLNIGTTPQVYVPALLADDQARCLRYYWKLGPHPTFPHWSGYQGAGLTIAITLPFPVPMAVAPTLTLGGTWAYIGLGSALAADSATVNGCRITFVCTGLGNGGAYSNNSGYLAVEANP